MKYILSILFFTFSIHANASCNSGINQALKGLKNASKMKFIEHVDTSDPKSFKNALALNVPYEPILKLRKIVEREIKRPLKFLTSWDPKGEAHVTTITPPEFSFKLSDHISMKEINAIARKYKIQRADLKVFGIGSAKKKIDGKMEETFFVIVESNKLRTIRQKIYFQLVKNGGDAKSFDPSLFYPHITIGFTKRDLHEKDGAVKNITQSLDKRFNRVDLECIND